MQTEIAHIHKKIQNILKSSKADININTPTF